MARQASELIQAGPPTEADLAEKFEAWIRKILVTENKELLCELTNLAIDEQDSGRRAGYFRIARLVQNRMPPKPEVKLM